MSQRQDAFRAMNTNVSVWLEPKSGVDQDTVQEVLTHTRLLFEQVENICSRFLPDSELVLLNQTAGTWVQVSALLFEVLEAAQDAFAETNGLYNPGLLVQLEEAGYDKSMEHLRDSDTAPLQTLLIPHAEMPYMLDKSQKAVQLHPGFKIDLGGIAKGWTVDRVARYLAQWGDGFVNAGGDLRVYGSGQKEWHIGVEDPFDREHDLGVLTIRTGAIATSSTVKRRWKKGGTWMSHLIDPRTGRPTDSDVASATVTAPTALQADVWAKTVLLLGMEAGAAWIRARQERSILVNHHRQMRSVENGLV